MHRIIPPVTRTKTSLDMENPRVSVVCRFEWFYFPQTRLTVMKYTPPCCDVGRWILKLPQQWKLARDVPSPNRCRV